MAPDDASFAALQSFEKTDELIKYIFSMGAATGPGSRINETTTAAKTGRNFCAIEMAPSRLWHQEIYKTVGNHLSVTGLAWTVVYNLSFNTYNRVRASVQIQLFRNSAQNHLVASSY